MRHQDEAVLIVDQITLQPFNMFDIEIIGRFVQNQDRRILQQQFGQQHLGALPAAQIADVPVQADIAKPQPVGHFLDFGVQHVEAAVIEQILQLTDIRHHLVQLVRIRLAHPVVNAQHLGFPVEHCLKGRAQNIPDGFSFGQHRVLIQITDRDAVGPLHLAGVRLQLPGNDAEKGGLAFAIGADQANMFALEEPERCVLQDLPSSEAVADIFNS